MVIRSFQDKNAEIFFTQGRISSKPGWSSTRSIVRRKLDMLHYARELKDLCSPPGNRLESLRGDWKGYYSIRINDQWRIVFKWDNQPYDVQIIDYH